MFFGKLEGTLLKREFWGRRKLAYEIQKYPYGLYYYFQYLGYNDLVGELERNFRILEPVLKYMTVKLNDDVDRGEYEASDDAMGGIGDGSDEAEAAASTESSTEESTPKSEPIAKEPAAAAAEKSEPTGA